MRTKIPEKYSKHEKTEPSKTMTDYKHYDKRAGNVIDKCYDEDKYYNDKHRGNRHQRDKYENSRYATETRYSENSRQHIEPSFGLEEDDENSRDNYEYDRWNSNEPNHWTRPLHNHCYIPYEARMKTIHPRKLRYFGRINQYFS